MNRSRALSLALLPALLLVLPGCDAAKKALDKAASKNSSSTPIVVRDLEQGDIAAFIRQPGKVSVVLIYDYKSEGGLAQVVEKGGAASALKAVQDYGDIVSVGRVDRSVLKNFDAHIPAGKATCLLFRDGERLTINPDGDEVTPDLIKAAVAREAGTLRSMQASPAVPGSNPPRELAEREFEGFIGNPDKLSVVVFHADWCGPCQKLKPVVATVADSFPGVSEVGRFNVDNCRDLAARLNVSGIPDVRFYRNGKEVGRFTGYRGEQAVRDLFKQHTAGLALPVAAPAAAPASTGAGSVTRMKKDWLPPGMEKR